MKIGFTSYINAYPFIAAWKKGVINFEADIVLDVPTNLNRRLKNGELDIALISSVEYLQNDYMFLAPYGIGSKGPILSVNFYIHEDLDIHDGLLCGITEESATSVKLLEVIAAKIWKKKLNFTPLDKSNKAFLLIGNQALEKQKIEGFKTIDLSELWYKETGCGFVFALFAARKGTKNTKIFCEKLESSLDWSKTHFDQILDMAMETSKHDPTFLKKYYDGHIYKLNEHLLGLNRFSCWLHCWLHHV